MDKIITATNIILDAGMVVLGVAAIKTMTHKNKKSVVPAVIVIGLMIVIVLSVVM